MGKALPRTRAVFRRLYARAVRRVPSLRVALAVGDPRVFPAARDYAYCELRGSRITIVVAPKMESAPRARIEGVLRHELAHAVFFALGEPRHAEADADRLAAALFGRPIRYDAAFVQTIGRGRYAARPRHLPA
jgi:Zn-dependent protease with chaperone function